MSVVHVYMNRCYDEAEVWCGELNYYMQDGKAVEPTNGADGATCLKCLDAAWTYGLACRERQLAVSRELGIEIPRHGEWPTEKP